MGAMEPKELRSELARFTRGRGVTKAVSCTLSHEVAWRLQQVASMMSVGPGQIVEVLIRDTVLAVRLPYDTYGRLPIAGTSASDGGVKSPAGEARGTVETLPIGEELRPSPTEGEDTTAGGGEGGRAHAPAAAPKARKRA